MFIFILGITLVLMGSHSLILAGWEVIGLLSFLLISYWGRNESLSGAVAAVCYNRIGDLFFMLLLMRQYSMMLLVVAILCKSAL